MPSLAGLFDSVQSGLLTLALFAALISVVVFFHELGHLLVGKYFGVRAERFSIGFGPRLWGFTWGETEYQVSALPLGGYVKFAGDNPHEELRPQDRGRGFLEATPAARAAIAVAGPAANFVLALVVAFALNLFPHGDLAPQVGFVKRGGPADLAGLRHGDKVLFVDDHPVRSFLELQELVRASPGKPLTMKVTCGARELELHVTPAAYEEKGPIETVQQGRIGVAASPRMPVIAQLGPETAAGKAGLRNFDTITRAGSAEVKNYEELIALLAERLSQPAGAVQTLELQGARQPPAGAAKEATPAEKPETFTAQLSFTPLGREVAPAEAEELLGLACADMNVAQLQPGSAAEKAGLHLGDRIVELQGRPVTWWADDIEVPRRAAGQSPLAMVLLREGHRIAVTVEQTLHQERDDAGVRVQVPELGALPDFRILAGEPALIYVRYGVGEAAVRAVYDVGDKTRQMALGLVRIVTGKLSSEAVGGPLMIADVTRKAADLGAGAFFMVLGLISLNLGLMNLIPLPVLDGFHILSAAIEAVRKRPLSVRFREAASMVGLVLVISLMLFALRNDVMRKFFD